MKVVSFLIGICIAGIFVYLYLFSLGFCFTYAAFLNFNIIYEIRNISDTNEMERILNKRLDKRYSDKFIDILLKMLEFNENRRMDFIRLSKYLKEIYEDDS